MVSKRLWIAPLAVPICVVSMLFTSAEKLRPASAGDVIDPTCTSSSPCIEYDNTSSGPGIRGTSAAGNGIGGSTKFKSTSATNGRSGIFGSDASTSGSFNAGVSGLSVRGIGVQGTGGAVGVKGIGGGTNGTGVEADSSNGSAIIARSTSGSLFYGIGAANPAFVVDTVGDTFTYGTAIVYQSVSAFGPSYGVTALVTGTNSAGAGVYSETQNPQSWIFRGYSDFHGAYVFEVADDGTVFEKAYGTLSAIRILQKTSTGQSVNTYAPQVSQPTVEDTGEAQLVNGVANVALEPRFAAAIDRRARYLVTVTPEGDCRGLYVAQRNGIGFTVRELQGGRSSLAFAYRIVAKPFGDTSARLPMASMPRGFTPNSERPPQPRLPRRP